MDAISSESIEVKGKNLKEALEQACDLLDIGMHQLNYKVISAKESDNSFAKDFGSIRIIAWPIEFTTNDLSNNIKSFVEGILKRMNINSVANVNFNNDEIRIVISTEFSQIITNKSYQIKDALQTLVVKFLEKFSIVKNINVDFENHKEKRDLNLKYVIKKICERAIKEKLIITLKPMNAYERRLVHLEVTYYPELKSKSIGNGNLKKIQIYSAKNDQT